MSSPDQDFPDSKRPNEPNDCQISSGNQTTESRVTSSSETSLVQTKKRIKVYPERLNRVRAKKPKTRTGCRTCKIRRVKCGEEFPTCLRCDKFGVKCDGYNNSQPQKQAKQPDLLSRRQGTPIRIMPKIALFQNENEHQYFLYFRDDITLDLSGNIPDKLWNLVILRGSVEEPALRHLSIAISALRKSQTYPDSPEAVTHHQFAISQYGRALKRVQDVLRTYRQEEAIRISLTASLLIFCFENTLGQHEQAVAHIRSALLLVRKRLAETPKPYVQWRTGSDLANLEGEVMDSFVRLDNILMTRLGDTSNDPRARSIEIKYSDDFKLPKRFRDSVEAKQYLEHLQFRAMPFFSYMPEFLATGRKHEPYIPPAEFYNIESHLDQFAAVFEPTLAKSSPEGDFKGWVAAATIRVQLLLTKVSLLRVSYGNNPIPADEFNEQCLEIVNLSARIIRDRRFRRTFVMSCDVLPALFVVLLICPGRVIKEEAIRILKSAAGRVEVIWDAVAIAAMGERILRAEGQAGADSRPWEYPRCQKVKINSLIPERHRNKDSDKAGYEY